MLGLIWQHLRVAKHACSLALKQRTLAPSLFSLIHRGSCSIQWYCSNQLPPVARCRGLPCTVAHSPQKRRLCLAVNGSCADSPASAAVTQRTQAATNSRNSQKGHAIQSAWPPLPSSPAPPRACYSLASRTLKPRQTPLRSSPS